jgi:hypothetical protein
MVQETSLAPPDQQPDLLARLQQLEEELQARRLAEEIDAQIKARTPWSTVRALADCGYSIDFQAWRQLVGTLALHAWTKDAEQGIADLYTGEPVDLAVTALGYGALLGYALARTWPERPERFDAWLETARRHAGLPESVFGRTPPEAAPGARDG